MQNIQIVFKMMIIFLLVVDLFGTTEHRTIRFPYGSEPLSGQLSTYDDPIHDTWWAHICEHFTHTLKPIDHQMAVFQTNKLIP